MFNDFLFLDCDFDIKMTFDIEVQEKRMGRTQKSNAIQNPKNESYGKLP